ncbi:MULTISPECIES: helix-turn-helix domain-containing protein [unclassified Bradyrhizobium]|uniref:helix-turn-helix domain-containing protein n=1 Tax=unclassified Bradyrhizobium TaxID=2631580 RepID=UPI0029167E48|nr:MULTISPECIES: helix-turn-helix domain-containing protein [unclassified Bradyrhizobium]
MSHDESKGNFKPTPIIKPYGVRIQVTAGNKLKFITAVQRAPKKELSDLQKRLYMRMIDKTNEGYGDDQGKHGHCYPNFVTLAEECGCTVSAVKANIAALETGVMKGRKRPDGTREADKIIPARWRIKVKRKGERGKGGAGRHNIYWLPLWNEFGAVEGDKNGPAETVHDGDRLEKVRKKTVHGDSKTVHEDSETVHGAHGNGLRRGPDSPQHSPHKFTSEDTTYPFEPASGERLPADLFVEGDERFPKARWYRASYWWFSMEDMDDAMELHGLSHGEVDAKIDEFVAEMEAAGELHEDWSPIWRRWIGLTETQDAGHQQPGAPDADEPAF